MKAWYDEFEVLMKRRKFEMSAMIHDSFTSMVLWYHKESSPFVWKHSYNDYAGSLVIRNSLLCWMSVSWVEADLMQLFPSVVQEFPTVAYWFITGLIPLPTGYVNVLLGAHESDPDLFTSTNVEDETLGGSFHTTPPRSTQVTPRFPPTEFPTDVSFVMVLRLSLPTVSPGSTTVSYHNAHPTHDKTFKQLKEERLGWEAAQRLQAQELAYFEKQRAESLMQDANLARQGVSRLEMTEDQRNRTARARMVALVNTQRKELAEQRPQEWRERPMTPSQLRQYMRTYVKNQGPAVYSTGWTMAQVRNSSCTLQGRVVDKNAKELLHSQWLLLMVFHRKKKCKTTPSRNVSREEVVDPSHFQDIPDAQVEVPSQKATIEDVEVPSNIASIAQHTASSLKKVEGDPEAEHKVCIKYASDVDSAFDDNTPVNLYDVVDTGELLSLTRTRKLREPVSDPLLHMFVTKKYPLSVKPYRKDGSIISLNFHVTVGNELTTAVSVDLPFSRNTFTDSKRPKFIDDFHLLSSVSDSRIGVGLDSVDVPSSGVFKERSV
ncbi:hypothetical protein Tco_0594772 [Tanacetum coccineum]